MLVFLTWKAGHRENVKILKCFFQSYKLLVLKKLTYVWKEFKLEIQLESNDSEFHILHGIELLWAPQNRLSY